MEFHPWWESPPAFRGTPPGSPFLSGGVTIYGIPSAFLNLALVPHWTPGKFRRTERMAKMGCGMKMEIRPQRLHPDA